MRKTLKHFQIGNDLGGNQDLFHDLTLKIGGCACVTACDICIDMVQNGYPSSLIPFDLKDLSITRYQDFAGIMKPYLHPRLSGITRLDTYTDGFRQYLTDHTDCGSLISFETVAGSTAEETAAQSLIRQIDRGLPVAHLLLKHRDRAFHDYEWHWFLITGYDHTDEDLMVQAVTYGESQWMDFSSLWNTGKEHTGGMVLVY